MRRLVCIFPEDESTDFLLPIYKQLENLSGFIGYRLIRWIRRKGTISMRR